MPLLEIQSDAVAEVYAQSLFDLAGGAQRDRAAIEQTLAELQAVVDLGRGDRRFGEFLASRIIPSKDKEQVLGKVFKHALSPTTLNFLLVLSRKGRLPHITAVLRAFTDLVQEAFGRVDVEVSTAAPLDPAAGEALRQRLSSALKREVIMHAKVDEALIGGVRVQVGDHLIDASVSTQLRRMRDQFEQSGLPAIRAIAGKLG